MISEEEARTIVEQRIGEIEKEIGEALGIVDAETIESDFGWVFFYNSKKYLENGEVAHMLAGNAPFIVDKHHGSLHETGTAHPIDYYIAQYRREHQKTE